jgi:hypothetical protein
MSGQTLQALVRLQIEIVPERISDAFVNDRSRLGISIVCSSFNGCRERPSVMATGNQLATTMSWQAFSPFAAHDDGQCRLWRTAVNLVERFAHEGEFLA